MRLKGLLLICFVPRMNTEIDFYEVLEVSPAASAAVIKAAYRCLTQLHHPDRHGGSGLASARQAQLNAAYATLSNPQSRRAYDRRRAVQQGNKERRRDAFATSGPRFPAAARPKLRAGEGMRPFAFRPLD